MEGARRVPQQEDRHSHGHLDQQLQGQVVRQLEVLRASRLIRREDLQRGRPAVRVLRSPRGLRCITVSPSLDLAISGSACRASRRMSITQTLRPASLLRNARRHASAVSCQATTLLAALAAVRHAGGHRATVAMVQEDR